jgi:hypothetical protein
MNICGTRLPSAVAVATKKLAERRGRHKAVRLVPHVDVQVPLVELLTQVAARSMAASGASMLF